MSGSVEDEGTPTKRPAGGDKREGETCPHCGSDQRGEQIPEEHLRDGYYGDWDGEPRYYSRTIMWEIPGIYDGGLFWACPDCGGRWHRWPRGSRLYTAAQPFVADPGRMAL